MPPRFAQKHWHQLRLRFLVAAVAIPVAILAMACDNGPFPSDGVHHPTPENLLAPSRVVQAISRRDTVPPSALLGRVAQRLRHTTETGSTDHDASGEELGHIADVTVGGDGIVYVLDAALNLIVVFDSAGRSRGSIRQDSTWTHSLKAPRHIVALPDSQLLIVDGSDRVHALHGVPKHPARPYRTWSVPELAVARVDDACSIDGTLFLRGRDSDNMMVRSVTAEGTLSTPFAEGYRSSSAVVRSLLSRGGIACDAASGLVLVSMVHVPLVTAYTVAGVPQWSLRLTDARPMRVESWAEPEEYVMRHTKLAHDYPVTLATLVPGVVLLQIAHVLTAMPANTMPALSSYLIATESGDAVYLGENLPFVVAASPRHLVTLAPPPIAAVRMFAY